MKKSFLLLLCIILCFVFVGCEYETNEGYGSESETKDISGNDIFIENETYTKTETSSVISFTNEELMVMQFERLGLTNEESKDAQKIFENVGITQIWDVSEFIQGSGIDGEQGFYCNFYDFNLKRDSIRLDFNIVKRKVQAITISWGRGENYPEISKYHDLKLLDGVKESAYGSYIYLYRKKFKNFFVDEGSVGYKAIYDRETHSISKYK